MADLTYRPLRPDDFDALHAMVSHWAVARQLGSWPWPADPAFSRSRCTAYDGRHGEGFVWAICVDDHLIGTLGVTGGSVGYMLDPAWQGQGIGGRALRHGIDTAFATQARDHLTAVTWADNAASRALLLGHGFAHWHTRFEQSKARKCPTLAYHYRLTRDDWHRLRAQAK